MKTTTQHIFAALAVMLSGLMLAPAVLAQSATQQAPTPPAFNSKDAGSPPTDAELGHFVDASLQVQSIGKQTQPVYQAAKSDADRAKVQKAAEAKMETAVKQNQLTIERYKQIFVSMQTNQTVHQKVTALVKQKQGK